MVNRRGCRPCLRLSLVAWPSLARFDGEDIAPRASGCMLHEEAKCNLTPADQALLQTKCRVFQETDQQVESPQRDALLHRRAQQALADLLGTYDGLPGTVVHADPQQVKRVWLSNVADHEGPPWSHRCTHLQLPKPNA